MNEPRAWSMMLGALATPPGARLSGFVTVRAPPTMMERCRALLGSVDALGGCGSQRITRQVRVLRRWLESSRRSSSRRPTDEPWAGGGERGDDGLAKPVIQTGGQGSRRRGLGTTKDLEEPDVTAGSFSDSVVAAVAGRRGALLLGFIFFLGQIIN